MVPAHFLVELRGDADRDGNVEPVEAARRQAAVLAACGEPVRVVRSVYAPEDDIWFLVLEAPSKRHVQRLLEGASLAPGAISTALSTVVPIALSPANPTDPGPTAAEAT